MPTPLLQACDVSKTFVSQRERRCVLDGIDLEIYRGDRVAFVGPNGSGKTTLLRILLGVEAPDSGKVTWHPEQQDKLIAYVPQDYRHALFPWFKLRTNLAMVSPAYRDRSLFSSLDTESMATLVSEYRQLERSYSLSLNLDKYPYELSGGEQQLFLLIRSIVLGSPVLVLDEPLSAVDYGRKKRIHDSLGSRISESKLTVLFSSHDFEEAVKLSDRVIVFTRDSGHVKAVIPVMLPWPRNNSMRDLPEFQSAVDAITAAIL